MLQVKEEFPPNYEQVAARFDIRGKGVVFTYGDTLFSPGGTGIPPHLMAHEEMHMVQQKAPGMTPELWWEKYLNDDSFRLDQELEAYQCQFKFERPFLKDRNRKARFLHQLASALSSPIYGGIISYPEAYRLIQQG